MCNKSKKTSQENLTNVTGKNTADTDDIDTSNDCESGYPQDSHRRMCHKFPLIAFFQVQLGIILQALEDYSALLYDLKRCSSPTAASLKEICRQHAEELQKLKAQIDKSLADVCDLGGTVCGFDWPAMTVDDPVVTCYRQDCTDPGSYCPVLSMEFGPEELSKLYFWHPNKRSSYNLQTAFDINKNKQVQDDQGVKNEYE